jgi:hypothetical protein
VGTHVYPNEGHQSWLFPAKGSLLISGLTWGRRPGDKMYKSQADSYADNGVYDLNRRSQLGLRTGCPGRLSS